MRPAISSVRGSAAENTVIPAKAGIQTEDVNTVYLDPRFRGGDENTVATQLLAPDLDCIALLEKQVEIAKMNLDYYERLHKRGYITSAQLAETELALDEAEYALKKTKEPGTEPRAVPGLSPWMGMSPATMASTPSSPALLADPDYIALLEKRVEVAKTEFRTRKEGNEKVPHTFPEIEVMKAELALAEAEYALRECP